MQVKRLFIEDCGMKDTQFANILNGVDQQGPHIKSIIYSNNIMGEESASALAHLVPKLKEIQLNNAGCLHSHVQTILESCLTNGRQLMKLKLSQINLGDHVSVKLLCQTLKQCSILTHLDVSWSKLTPFHLLDISEVLMDNDHPPIRTLRNLNLSYNSLHIDECAIDDGPNEDFLENFIEFISYSEVLNHLDISGMSLGRDYNPEQFTYQSWVQRHNTTAPILALCSALSSSYCLMSLHMSDNGLRDDEELFLEVLDYFGLDQ